MQEALLIPNTSTTKPLNTFANYTGLLKNQIGLNANTLISSIPVASFTWTYNPVNNLTTSNNVNLNFVNVTSASQYTNVPPENITCTISYSVTTNGNILAGNLNGDVNGFADFKVLDPSTGTFKFNVLTSNGNDFTVIGKAPCLKMVGCEPCPIKDTLLLSENFDTYNTSITSASQLPFTTSYTDITNNVLPINFAGMNVCNIFSIGTTPQFSILSDPFASCFGSKKAYDHTKVNPIRNFLSVTGATINNPIIPYQKTLNTLTVGKQYEFSFYHINMECR